MRDIRFKAKRIDNGEWVEGFYCKRKTRYYDNIGFHDEYKNCIIVEFSDGGIDWCDVDPSTICQYTGLTDKNGRKIWENDIVKYTDMITYAEKIDRIEWNETHASFVRLHKIKMGFQYLNIDEFIANRCEVIGNIFDNPELLEAGKKAGECGNQDLLMPLT